MANKYHQNLTGNGKHKGGAIGPTKAQGTGGPQGETRKGPDRSGGDPTTGKRGPFYVKKSGL